MTPLKRNTIPISTTCSCWIKEIITRSRAEKKNIGLFMTESCIQSIYTNGPQYVTYAECFELGLTPTSKKPRVFWRIQSVAQLQLQVNGATGGGLAYDSSLLDLKWIGWLKTRCPCGILGALWKRRSIALVREILQWIETTNSVTCVSTQVEGEFSVASGRDCSSLLPRVRMVKDVYNLQTLNTLMVSALDWYKSPRHCALQQVGTLSVCSLECWSIGLHSQLCFLLFVSFYFITKASR